MADIFNAEETLEMACQIERNGARYYRRAAELVKTPDGSQMLLELAAMEDDHEAAFAAMKQYVSGQSGALGELTDEAVHYLKAIADGHIFPVGEDPAENLPEGISMKEVLRRAIGMEKDSIVFYLGIRDAMPAALGRDKVEMIIGEEMRHVAILSDWLSEIVTSGRETA